MIRVTTILFFLLTYMTCPVSAQSNFALPKVAQKKYDSHPTAKQANKKEVKSRTTSSAVGINSKSIHLKKNRLNS